MINQNLIHNQPRPSLQGLVTNRVSQGLSRLSLIGGSFILVVSLIAIALISTNTQKSQDPRSQAQLAQDKVTVITQVTPITATVGQSVNFQVVLNPDGNSTSTQTVVDGVQLAITVPKQYFSNPEITLNQNLPIAFAPGYPKRADTTTNFIFHIIVLSSNANGTTLGFSIPTNSQLLSVRATTTAAGQTGIGIGNESVITRYATGDQINIMTLGSLANLSITQTTTPTATPTTPPVATATPTTPATATLTPTASPIPTATPTVTVTATPTSTLTPIPTATPGQTPEYSLVFPYRLQGLNKTGIMVTTTVSFVPLNQDETINTSAQIVEKEAVFSSNEQGWLRPTTPIDLAELKQLNPDTRLYQVKVKTPVSLRKILGQIELDPTINSIVIDPTTGNDSWVSQVVKIGDFVQVSTGYNQINLLDIGNILAIFQELSIPITDSIRKYDVNYDNQFNILDIGLVLANWTELSIMGD